VHQADTQRGEESELVNPGAGTIDVVLDNNLRTFDPLHASGPFFGELLIDTPLRIRAVLEPDSSSPVVYPIALGYIEGWPITYRDAGIVSDTSVTASDALRVLGEATAPDPTFTFPEESTGDRITRVLDLAGWPAALRAIDPGEMICAAGVIGDGKIGDYLALVNATEQGSLFVDRAGKVTFHNRGHTLSDPRSTSSQFDFVAGGEIALAAESVRIAYDNRFVYDSAIIEREGGTPQAADNGTTKRTFTASGLLHASDAGALALAEYIVYRYGVPLSRADAWTVQPELNPADWGDLLALERNDMVRLEFTPGDIGFPVEFDLILSKQSHQITPEQWLMSFYGTPADPNAALYFTWDGDDTTQGWDIGVWR
jgi:hypothetical protein